MAAIERLWCCVTVFDEMPRKEGVAMNLKRLRALRDEINKVIAELEEEEWLS